MIFFIRYKCSRKKFYDFWVFLITCKYKLKRKNYKNRKLCELSKQSTNIIKVAIFPISISIVKINCSGIYTRGMLARKAKPLE